MQKEKKYRYDSPAGYQRARMAKQRIIASIVMLLVTGTPVNARRGHRIDLSEPATLARLNPIHFLLGVEKCKSRPAAQPQLESPLIQRMIHLKTGQLSRHVQNNTYVPSFSPLIFPWLRYLYHILSQCKLCFLLRSPFWNLRVFE